MHVIILASSSYNVKQLYLLKIPFKDLTTLFEFFSMILFIMDRSITVYWLRKNMRYLVHEKIIKLNSKKHVNFLERNELKYEEEKTYFSYALLYF